MFQKSVKVLFFITLISVSAFAQTPANVESAVDSVVTILLANEGTANAVGSGVIVRADGFILTAHHLVKGAREIQVRLRNGEIFDKAEIVGVDERRNVALLRINAAGLRTMPSGTIEESQVGARIFIITNPTGETQITNTILNSVQLADSIQGSGNGYRVLQFAGRNNLKSVGGLVFEKL